MTQYIQRTQIVSTAFIGILCGVYFAKFGYHTDQTFIIAAFLCLPFASRSKIASLVPAIAIGLSIGLWRGHMTYINLEKYNSFKDHYVTVTAKVENDAAYADKGQLEFVVGNITETTSGLKLPGTIRIRGFNSPSVRRADIVRIEGKLRSGFGSRQGFISYAQVNVISRDDSWLERTRSEYFAGVYNALPEPHASLGLGFLVGTRTLLPEALLSALSITGLTHIIAVSGYNLTILVRLTRRLFSGRSVYLAAVSPIALIAGFVLVTGQSPSIIRATVVSLIAICAWYYGRKIKPTMLLLASASITSLMNPFFIWSDIGWYLSFAAFTGILILAPLLSQRVIKKKPKLIEQIILETTCAQIMTIPIIMLTFSQVSIISLLANVVVLPLIPVAMLTTFLAGLAGMTAPAIAGWFAWPAQIILTFVVDVVNMLAKIPWALSEISTNMGQVLIFYHSIFLVIIGLSRHYRGTLNAAEVIE